MHARWTINSAQIFQLSVLKGKNITHLALGGSEQVDSHTLAIVHPGKLFATGDNTYGQLVYMRNLYPNLLLN